MFCSRCGAGVGISDNFCANCGTKQPTAAQGLSGYEKALRLMLPIGRSWYAIVAGYLGLLSAIPIFAPFAIIYGILALRDLKKHPELCGSGRAIFGIVMGIIGTIFWIVFAYSAAARLL